MLRRTSLLGVAPLVFVAAASMSPAPANAQTVVWTGTESADWYAPGNWSLGSVPAGGAIEINTTEPNPTVVDGGPGMTGSTIRIGRTSADEGDLTVRGGATLSFGNNVYVGDNGTGQLTVLDATVNAERSVIGERGEGHLVLSGPDARWAMPEERTSTVSRHIRVGNHGIGRFTIEAGATAVSDIGYVADNPGSEGFVTVTGPGSSWTMNTFRDGDGDATIEINDGGQITNTSAWIGIFSTGTASMTVTGAGSAWSTGNEFIVGGNGNAEMEIADQARVTSGSGYIGYDLFNTRPGSDRPVHGAVTVTGAGSAWEVAQDLVVGDSTHGTLTVTDGGHVTSAEGVVGLNRYFQGRPNQTSGTATVAGEGSTWSVGEGGLYLGVLPGSTGTLTVEGGGIVQSSGETLVAQETGSAGTLNIGAAADAAPRAPGILDTGEVAFGTGTGIIVFNHTDPAYRFDPAITDYTFDDGRVGGAGSVVRQLAGTTILTGASSYSGATEILGGALVVQGSLGETEVRVSEGAGLGGTGMIAGSVVNAGTLVPGDSIGTLGIGGDLTFAPGAIYAVEVNPEGDESDRIAVAGTAFLEGGTVAHVGIDGPYDPNASYTILTADGGVVGTFDGVVSDFAFLDPRLGYDASSVTLFLERNDIGFGDIALTRNQRAAASGIETLGAGNPVHDAVVALDAGTARSALDQLSGEIHASAQTALLEDSRHVREAVMERLRQAFASPDVPTDPRPGSANTGDTGFVSWGRVFGSWGEIDGDGNAATLERDTGGFLVGADGLVAERFRLGFMAGYSDTRFDVDGRRSSGSSESYHLGVYGGTRIGALGLRAGAAYARHDIETERSIGLPAYSDRLDADYDAATAQVFGEVGYALQAGPVAVEPFLGLAYVNLDVDDFTEDGGAAALSGEDGSSDTVFSTIGLRAGREIALGTATVRARGMIGWRHAFDDAAPLSRLAFDGGTAFTVAGVPLAEDVALLDLHLGYEIDQQASLGLSYGGQFGSDLQDHSARATFTYRF